MNAQELKRLRKSKGLTQREFADRLKVSYSAITKMETGKLAVSALVQERLKKDQRSSFLVDNFTAEQLALLEKAAAERGLKPDDLGADIIRAFLSLRAPIK